MLSSSIVLFEAFGQKLRLREALLSLLAGSVLLNVWLFSRLQSLDVNQQKSIHTIHLESLPANRAHTGDAGLQCEAYGGPFEKSAVADIVYWHDDVPMEQQFKSVYEPVDGQEKYFVFEPDEAGFSNVRLSFETVAAFSLAMGRTLVMPPKNPITQLTYQHPEGIRSYSFSDFFSIRNLTMISMQEYLERVALKGRLRDANGVVAYPPFRRTNWNTRPGEVGPFELELFYDWLSKSMHAIDWNRDECIIAFPADRKKGIGSVQADVSNILLEDKKSGRTRNGVIGPDSRNQGFVGNPVPVNSSSYDRLREVLGYRNRLCLFDEYWQSAESLFMSGHERSGKP
jgi:GDP-fucose protein O-fucosyltransferase